MPSRRWMWIRPTPHIYNYNRELSSFNASSSAASASTAAATLTREEQVLRRIRATSEAATDRTSMARTTRASTVAPEPGTGLTGYTGFYGRQLALLKESEEARRAEAALASTAASRRSAAAAASSSSSSSATAASARSVTATAQTSCLKASRSVETREEQRNVSFLREQQKTIQEGRQSMSRAVRRAEYHAQTSATDPRHVGVPRDITDDICKKVADICITPYEGREIGAAKAAQAQSRLKIERLEKELDALTVSAMKYKSSYLKSAHQMAADAMMAADAEAAASIKKTRKTVVEESSRRQVAAA